MAFKIFGAVATATALAALCTVASAQTPLPTNIQVSKPGDGQMACPQIAMEIGLMDQVMGQAATNQANANTNNQVAGAVGAAAVNGALYSGALGAVPGLGFLARGAEQVARSRAESQAQTAAKLQADAQMRRTMLNGIYQGKGCDQPQPQAVQAVTPAPGMPPANGTITYAPGQQPAPPAQ